MGCERCDHFAGRCIVFKDMFLPVFIYVGKVDDPEIQVRPVDESWMEDTYTTGVIEYDNNRRTDPVETKQLAFLNTIYLRPNAGTDK